MTTPKLPYAFDVRAERAFVSDENGNQVETLVSKVFLTIYCPGGDERDYLWDEAPDDTRTMYLAEFEAWQRNEEPPVDGTDLRLCAAFSAADVKILHSKRIRTVEELANTTDAGLREMGLRTLKNKAIEWLKSRDEPGRIAQANAALQDKVADQEEQLRLLREQIAALTKAQEVTAGKKAA